MNILLVDDDPLSRESISDFITNYLHYNVEMVDSGKAALTLLSQKAFDLVISDIRMPGLSGLDLLEKIKAMNSEGECDVLLITGYGDVATSVKALRLGAADYLLKPINVEELAHVIDIVKEKHLLRQENRTLKEDMNTKVEESTKVYREKLSRLESAYREVMSIGKVGVFSKKMKNILEIAEKMGKDRMVPVLIEGETGTGKEIIAHVIHQERSNEPVRPFITINCSAISPNLFESELFGYEEGAFTGAKKKGSTGKLELAQGGTIFFDEIGDMPMDMQPKLLRVLQQREMYKVGGKRKIRLDVRFIFATNKNLIEKSEMGEFRSDLYYRINTGYLKLPPLRERREKIIPLASLFLTQATISRKKKFKIFTPGAVEILQSYNWPGNVRELKNSIERVVLLYDSPQVTGKHLGFLGKHSPDRREDDNSLLIEFSDTGVDLKEIEQRIIEKALQHCKNNKTKTAQYLGIARNTLINKLRKP